MMHEETGPVGALRKSVVACEGLDAY